MDTHVDMAGAFAVSRVLTHEDTRGVVLPKLSRLVLRTAKAFEEDTQVQNFFARLASRNKLSFAAAQGNTALTSGLP